MKKIILTLCLMAWITGYVEVPLSKLRIHRNGNCYVLDENGTPIIPNAVILIEKDEKALLHIKVPESRTEAVVKHGGWLAWSKKELLELRPDLGGTKIINTEEGPVQVNLLPEHDWMQSEKKIEVVK